MLTARQNSHTRRNIWILWNRRSQCSAVFIQRRRSSRLGRGEVLTQHFCSRNFCLEFVFGVFVNHRLVCLESSGPTSGRVRNLESKYLTFHSNPLSSPHPSGLGERRSRHGSGVVRSQPVGRRVSVSDFLHGGPRRRLGLVCGLDVITANQRVPFICHRDCVCAIGALGTMAAMEEKSETKAARVDT